jgi:ABC-type antimicrobial peptide transport system permease subunit
VGHAAGNQLKTEARHGVKIHVKSEPSRWENKYLRNFWALIPGAHADLGREVAVITAPIDSNCIVPEMAYGAQNGANLLCLKKILDDFLHHKPARSVLLVAVNAHTQGNLGERMLAWHMLAKEEEVEKIRNTLMGEVRAERVFIDYYSGLHLDSYNREDEQKLISWRSLLDDSSGKNITVKSPVVTLAKGDINRLKNELVLLDQQNLSKKEKEKRKAGIRQKIEKYVKVLILFNKIGHQSKLSDLSREEVDILQNYVREVIKNNSLSRKLNEDDLQLNRQNDAIRDALKGNKIVFIISLALDWAAPKIGFFANITYGPRWAQRWGANTFEIAGQLEEVGGGKENYLEDTLTMRSGYGENYYFGGRNCGAAYVLQAANKMPVFELMDVFSASGNLFLPSDTADGLNKTNFANKTAFLISYFHTLLGVRHITDSSQLDPSNVAVKFRPMKSILIKTYKFDEYSASINPEVPVPDTAVIVRSPAPADVSRIPFQSGAINGDISQGMIVLTDDRAAAVLYGLIEGKWGSTFATSAFHFDKAFTAVNHAIDAGDVQAKMSSDYLSQDRIINLIECDEYIIYPLADSSLVSTTPIYTETIIPLTAKGNSSPRKYGITGVKSAVSKKSVFFSAGAPAAYYSIRTEKTKIITDKKRLALRATEKEYEGQGYGYGTSLGADYFRDVVRDMSVLNKMRLKKLRDVANELVGEFAQRGDKCLASMNSSLKDSNYLQYLRNLYEALGSHVKSYEQAKQTTDDMLKAIVVYMALLLPFCFFIEKLLFNFVKIEHEMGMFAVLFVITFLVFQQIHPAFRIAQAPQAIFIAFVMGIMGLFVISILRGRFEGEMQLLFRSYLSGIMDEAAYSAVTQKAMLIGVNNMKRRRIRTMLTTMTIVLIAFSMLSFTSISKKVKPTIIRQGILPPYTGFMFTWPGKSQMEEATFNVMRDLFSAYGQVVDRRWRVMSARENIPYHLYVSDGKETKVEAILGLSVAEDGFIEKMPIVAGRYFSSNGAWEALISSQMAEVLGIDPARLEGVVVNCGYDFKVVGIYDDNKIKNIKDLNGVPILPIKRISQQVGGFGNEVEAEEELHNLGSLFFVDTTSLLIIPSDVARKMGAFAFSISVKMKEDAPVQPLMDLILTSTMAKFYMSSLRPFSMGGDEKKEIAAGAYYIGTNYRTSVGGLAVLLIPLFIAATIILNTMLGSVYERKKEIAVYNAIGLNPHHIGLFFLAESFVYGVLGAVGGYLIGQLLSLGINYFGLVKGINFNYSSLSVAYVILFTITIVLLSTIYPALAAVRTAVPSGKRTWSMPPHHGNIMEIVFPFIYQSKIASGMLAYLREYFGRFSEVSIGDLIATQLAHSCRKDEEGHEAFKLDYHIALAPYDLGVTENLNFALSYDKYVKAYRLSLVIDRVSGQDINWITTNRPFLERLRKYLMRWRNLSGSQQALYVQQSSEALGLGNIQL